MAKERHYLGDIFFPQNNIRGKWKWAITRASLIYTFKSEPFVLKLSPFKYIPTSLWQQESF